MADHAPEKKVTHAIQSFSLVHSPFAAQDRQFCQPRASFVFDLIQLPGPTPPGLFVLLLCLRDIVYIDRQDIIPPRGYFRNLRFL